MEQTVQVSSNTCGGTTGATQHAAECFLSYMWHVQRVGACPRQPAAHAPAAACCPPKCLAQQTGTPTHTAASCLLSSLSHPGSTCTRPPVDRGSYIACCQLLSRGP